MNDLATQLREGPTPETDAKERVLGGTYAIMHYVFSDDARSLERRLNVAVEALDILKAEVLFVLADGKTRLEDFNNNEAIKHTRNALHLIRGPQ